MLTSPFTINATEMMTLREHNGDIIFKKGSTAFSYLKQDVGRATRPICREHSDRSDHMETRLMRQIPILHLQTIFLWIENVIPFRVGC